jgi:hypothetical protein
MSQELREAAIDHGDKRGVRLDEAELAGTKPGPNADIERLLELYDELPSSAGIPDRTTIG